jgi:hypothetical protein
MEREPNEIYFRPSEETAWGGLRGLNYGFGNFRCEPGQAVIIEVDPPPCHYWSFSLGNWYWETIGWANRQSSLNGHQARLDPDGVFRAVICHQDPGVFNWLDPAGGVLGAGRGPARQPAGRPGGAQPDPPGARARRPSAQPPLAAAGWSDQGARHPLLPLRRSR